MHIYDRLGVKRRINAAGPQTRLGGAPLSADVLAAMNEAAEASVDMAELQSAASDVIAQATGAEAGIVTAGAAAALTLATGACLTGLDPAKMDRLPDTSDMPNEVVIARMQRTSYDHAIRAAGAKLVEIGFNDRAAGCGVRGVESWEIEAAIGTSTVAIAYGASQSTVLPLRDVVAVAQAHGLPVIVDAAAQLPPVDNLRRFIAEGASLVAFSGGKAIGGPQASGILCGRRDLIAAALLQQLDMDIDVQTWRPQSKLICLQEIRGLPHHGIGRGFKVGKEEIAGLIVALDRFASSHFEQVFRRWHQLLEVIQQELRDLPGVEVSLVSSSSNPKTDAPPILELQFPGRDVRAISRALKAGVPPVEVGEARIDDGMLVIKPIALKDDDAKLVAQRIIELL